MVLAVAEQVPSAFFMMYFSSGSGSAALCIQCRSSNNEHQEITATIVAIIHTMITAVIRRLKGFLLVFAVQLFSHLMQP